MCIALADGVFAGVSDHAFAGWQAVYFDALELLYQDTCGLDADSDQDGLSNLEEYAFALNPTQFSAPPGIRAPAVGSNYVSFLYTRIHDRTDISFIPEVSTNLTDWAPGSVLSTQTSTPSGEVQQVDEEVTLLCQDTPTLFARIKAAWTGRVWKADILWFNQSTYTPYVWLINGTNIMDSDSLSSVASAWSLELRADLNGDGQRDIVWHNNDTGDVGYWLLNGVSLASSYVTNASLSPSTWKLTADGDLNGDGKDDLLWQNLSSGGIYLWIMDCTNLVGIETIVSSLSLSWHALIGTFNDDDKDDMFWHDTDTGDTYIWLMDAEVILISTQLMTVGSTWTPVFTGDFDGDSKGDILWRNTSTGGVNIWFMDGVTIRDNATIVASLSSSWTMSDVADFNGDGKTDILWRNTSTGNIYIWIMNGATIAATPQIATGISSTWLIIP